MKLKKSCPSQARCRRAASQALKAWSRGVDIITEDHMILGQLGPAQDQARRRAAWKAHRAADAILRGVPRMIMAPLSRREDRAYDMAQWAVEAACGSKR